MNLAPGPAVPPGGTARRPADRFAYVVPMIRYDVGDDGVARLVLDRAEAKNALSIEIRDDIVRRVREARADPSVRAVLVTGVGDSFCAGMDLRASTVSRAGAEGFDPRATSEALRNGVQAFIRELWELDKPTVAAVNGTAVGPGAHLAWPATSSWSASTTRFIWSFAKWGLVVDAGGAYLLPRLVGLPRAKAMVMLGEGGRGDRSRRPGTRLPLPGHARGPGGRRPSWLSDWPPARPGRSGCRSSCSTPPSRPTLPTSLDREAHAQAMATVSPEMAEGMAAFAERRTPDFRSAQ